MTPFLTRNMIREWLEISSNHTDNFSFPKKLDLYKMKELRDITEFINNIDNFLADGGFNP